MAGGTFCLFPLARRSKEVGGLFQFCVFPNVLPTALGPFASLIVDDFGSTSHIELAIDSQTRTQNEACRLPIV